MDPVGLGEREFGEAAAALSRELYVHCYRMLGSVDGIDDLVQDTMLRAWRARSQFDPSRASLRTWMYRIATNVCLTALKGRSRRPLPSGLGPASTDPSAPLTVDRDIAWLQPLPGSRTADGLGHRESAQTSGVRLAFIAALQLLTPRQRATLLLRDVLDFTAAETAHQLGLTVASVNSGVRRARATLAASHLIDEDIAEPSDPQARETVERYITAFQSADVAGLVALLAADVIMEMPPVALWYRGPTDYGAFMTRIFHDRRCRWRMVQTIANAQPALAAYRSTGDGPWEVHTLQVLTITTSGVARNVVFQDAKIFAAFGLAHHLAAD